MRSPALVLVEIFAVLTLWGCGCFQPVVEFQCSDSAPCARGRCVAGACVGAGGGGGSGSGGGVQGSCVGCEVSDGACIDGRSAWGCGKGGGRCVICKNGETCQNGACALSPCNPVSCPDGCCVKDQCVRLAEQSNMQCGTHGADCAGCATGERCRLGTCTALPCGPQTCGTCCDQGMCLAPSTLTGARCGAGGSACSACPQYAACSAGQCVVPSCNPGNCGSGCCVSGACAPGDSHASCGSGASSCQGCSGAQRCANGACTNNRVGDPCVADAECAAAGAGAYCKHFTSSLNGDYPGGFCTRGCGRGSPDGGRCGAGQVCLDSLQPWGEDDAFCSPACTSKPQCRIPEYDCYYVNHGSQTACWLKPLPVSDGGDADAGARDGGAVDAGATDAGP